MNQRRAILADITDFKLDPKKRLVHTNGNKHLGRELDDNEATIVHDENGRHVQHKPLLSPGIVAHVPIRARQVEETVVSEQPIEAPPVKLHEPLLERVIDVDLPSTEEIEQPVADQTSEDTTVVVETTDVQQKKKSSKKSKEPSV